MRVLRVVVNQRHSVPAQDKPQNWSAMPVEIRELVIQAKLAEEISSFPGQVIQKNPGVENNLDLGSEKEEELTREELADLIVEKCMLRLQEWLSEKSMR